MTGAVVGVGCWAKEEEEEEKWRAGKGEAAAKFIKGGRLK